ncbi:MULTISPECIES: GTP-binding protein [unclassified Algibacter]|uniref:GTP-binding protein n=1 Tax=unclassified Algibacter TaxID=2615009 RepID=UPI00131D310A|nr:MULTISPECIES: GTP-binding protein [unclassified Algibacter]MCL5127643.1 GTP-binding protein [Algibacter sp. L4_22]
MNTPLNEIVLRPRFKIELPQANTAVLKKFEDHKTLQSNFIVSTIDDHVFIKLPKEKQHFWSPQLHLEINEVGENSSIVRGLFGPSPAVWTMFMFFHFAVAMLFIVFSIWAYSNWALKTTYQAQIMGLVLLTGIWFTLYFAGRVSKFSNQKEMNALYVFMTGVFKA